MHYKKGIVTSAKGNKTVVVLVTEQKMHPKYRKYYTSSKKFHAHDEDNRYHEGDEVIIRQVRPLSKTKNWLCVPAASIDKLRQQAIAKEEAKEAKKAEMVTKMIDKMKKGEKSATKAKKESKKEEPAEVKKAPAKKAPVKKSTSTSKKSDK